MRRVQTLTSSTTTSAMDIDPHSSKRNSSSPNFLEAKRNGIHLEDNTNGHAIGSPPPAGAPKAMWDGNFKEELSNANPQAAEGANVPTGKETMDTSELSLRVKDIRLQPPQPMIICEIIEDEKDENKEMAPGNAVSLTVPPVDVANEKKRPPISAPF